MIFSRTFKVGQGCSVDLDLASYGYCQYVSQFHASIFFDQYSRVFELINYRWVNIPFTRHYNPLLITIHWFIEEFSCLVHKLSVILKSGQNSGKSVQKSHQNSNPSTSDQNICKNYLLWNELWIRWCIWFIKWWRLDCFLVEN